MCKNVNKSDKCDVLVFADVKHLSILPQYPPDFDQCIVHYCYCSERIHGVPSASSLTTALF